MKFFRVAASLAVLLLGGWTHGVSRFNGGASQVNFNFLQIGGAFPFINHLKTSQNWSNVNGVAKGMPPTEFDANGYPLSALFTDPDAFGGVVSQFYIPTSTNYSGNSWVLKGTGTCSIGMSSAGTVSGLSPTSASLVSGGTQRVVVTYTATVAAQPFIQVSITSTDVTTPCTDLAFYRLDEEANYNRGEIFSPTFKNKLREGNFGVLRFLNWQGNTTGGANTSNVALWEHRKPLNYVFYEGFEFRSAYYAGVTTNSGDDYSATLGSGAPTDKQLIHVKFNATASTNAPTLNLNGSGAVIIKNMFGDTLGNDGNNEKPAINRIATMVYNATLNAWIKTGGDSSFLSQGLNNGVPPELLLQLCIEMGAHPWFIVPYLAMPVPAATTTDYLANLATYVRVHSPGWMIPRYEVVPNENWNGVFYANIFGQIMGTALWSSPSNNNFYGMAGSIGGQAVSAVYSNDRTKYQVISGVQQVMGLSASSSDPLLTSALYVSVNGGSPAYNWVTHVAPSTYVGATMTDSAEIAAAYAYSTGDTAQPEAFVQSTRASLVTCPSPFTSGHCQSGLLAKQAYYAGWYAWAQAMSVPVAMTSYEGWWSPDYFTNDINASKNTVSGNAFSPTVTAISKAAQAVVTLNANSAVPVAGMTMQISGVVGMTQINGNSYTVVSVAGQDVTLLVDSTGFATYISGGTGVYVGAAALRNNLRQASKNATGLYQVTLDNMSNFTGVGASARFPSLFQFSGDDTPPPGGAGLVWSLLAPDIYVSPNPPGWNAFKAYNAN